jgi:hypothetical protein
VNFISYWESLHKHAHCMSWVIYLKFLSTGNFVQIELLTLNYIFTYFWNAFWLLYQLIIYAYSEADIRENYLSANFPSVSVFQCEAPERSLLASKRVWLRRLDGLMTHRDTHGFVECLCGIPHPGGLVVRPDKHPTGIKIVFQP